MRTPEEIYRDEAFLSDSVQMDEDARVSIGEDDGAWVQVWLWVPGTPAKCGNCGWAGLLRWDDPEEIPGYSERVDEDGPEPVGECPGCGSLAYEIEVYA